MKKEIKNLEERAKNLARKKASLQQIVQMMENLKLVPSVEHLIENILHLLLENIGGQNLSIYYIQESSIFYADIMGKKHIVGKIEDSLIRKVFETREIVEIKHEFKDTLMLTREFNEAVTWVFPIIFDKQFIGAIKIENIVGTQELRDEMPTFFNYVALLLTNQIQSEKLQWANNQLEDQLEEIQRTEEALRINEKRLNAALEAAHEFWYELNYITWEMLLSDQIYNLLGLEKSQQSNDLREWIKRVHPDDLEHVNNLISKLPKFENDEFFKIEFRAQKANGEYIWLLCSGKKIPSDDKLPSHAITGTLIDINDTKIYQEKLRLSAQVFEQSSEGIIITDNNNNIVSVNRSFTEITGYRTVDVYGKNPRILSSGRHGREFFLQMWQHLENMGYWKGEIWNRRKNGEIYLAWLSISQIVDSSGKIMNYIGIFNDITYFKETERHIQELVHYDPLTGLPNKTLVNDRITQAITRAQRDKEILTIMFIDLDQFKHINDTLGHKVGDELLIQVSQRFKSALREEDTLSRFGGDEFIVLLPNTDMHGASLVAQKLLNLNQKPFEIGEHELMITSSIGAAIYPTDGKDIETLYRCADTAMYRAKKEGRNSFRFFTLTMQESSARNLHLINALRKAVDQNELSVHYQPQISVATGKLIGAEALIRWHQPELGIIPPSEFIPLAEESGLILNIGEWILKAALTDLKNWLSQGIEEFNLAVNLSAIQLKHPGLPDFILQLLNELKIPSKHLELELTESVAMENPEAAIIVMDILHQKGVKFAIDDFGTGYSSLSYLKRFRIDKLKIDRSFVSDLGKDPEDEGIVQAIMSMARALNLHTLAEGVETGEQLNFLQNIGCDEVQGFFFSKALPREEFENWVFPQKV